MSLKQLLEKPRSLNQDAKYTVLNGVRLHGSRHPAHCLARRHPDRFLGRSIRGTGRSAHARNRPDGRGDRLALHFWRPFRHGNRFAASVIDRLVFVPLVLIPAAIAGVFPHLFITSTLLDASLATGAWALLARE
jgi:hypothetical protein